MSTQRRARGWRPWTAGVLSAALLLATLPSHAQEPGTPSEADRERAAALFSESAEHYRAGRFEKAIALLREAHQLVGEPVLLYNLARAYEGHGELEEAIAAYRHYLADSSEVKDRGSIEQRIATLEGQLAVRQRLERDAEAARQRAAQAEADAQREPAPSASPYPWIIAGVGAATLVAGAVLGGLSRQRAGKAEDEPQQIPAADLRDQAQTLATGANITFAVGGAILAGGVAWGIADIALLPGHAPKQALRVELGANHVRLRLRF